MRTVLKLARASLREHPVRLVLTSLATVAAACIVVWVASGYDTLLATFDEFAGKAMGRYTLSVAPIATAEEVSVPPAVIDALRKDPAVTAAEPMWLQRVPVKAPEGVPVRASAEPGERGPSGGRTFGGGLGMGQGREEAQRPGASGCMLLGTDSPHPPFTVLRGQWLAPGAAAPEAVISATTARRLGVDVGGQILAGAGPGLALRVVGVIDAPVTAAVPAGQLPSPSSGEVFVPLALAGRIAGRPAAISFIGVCVKDGTDLASFRFGWAPRLGRFAVPVQFQEAHDIEERLDETAAIENVQIQAYAATGIAMLVALLVIFSTLNMGVSERVRQLAILRAILLTRAQVGGIIVLEGLLLATIGFAGGLGAGWLLLNLAARGSAKLLHHGPVIGGYTIALAALASYGGALLASVLPARRATGVRPLDAMAPAAGGIGGLGRFPWVSVLVGLALIAVNPLLTFVFPPRFGSGVGTVMGIGLASMALGFVLVAPGVIVLVDRLVSPLLARALALEPRLLASQISRHLWRTVGATVSMTIGLGLYLAIQVWGFTMLDSFMPGRWAPDALIAFRPAGLSPQDAAAVAALPGVDGRRCLPLVVEQPRLRDDITGSAGRASITRQDNVVIVGLDLPRALDGRHPLLDFDWVQGSPATVAAAVARDRHSCVVPDHFLRESGLRVGDSFWLVPPEAPARPVQYTVAGSVRLPGWHWQTKHTGFRPRTHRAAALVFADYASVAGDFGKTAASHVWLRYGSDGVNPAALGEAARSLYSDLLHRPVAVGQPAAAEDPSVAVMPVEEIRQSVREAAKRWLWMVSQLPLIALVVACLGVLNVMLASIRARRWDMGILRALGFTRWTLVRAIIAEGLLVGVVAWVLSMGFGIVAGWCGCGIAQYISFFGGMNPSLVIPWSEATFALLLVLILSGLTALWPAVTIGRARPLTLLQQGRGAF